MKKSQKHDANLQKNSTLYFQVGLIVCFLFTYGLLEMKFETNTHEISEVIYDDPDDYVINVNPIIEQPMVQKQIKKSIPKRLIDVIKTVPDNTVDIATAEIVVDPPKTDGPVAVTFIPRVKPPVDDVDILFHLVEVSPIFPGCEKSRTNQERKACMTKKISKHIKRKFDTDVANGLGLSGKQRINVAFKINQNGDIVEVAAITKHKALKLEAEDVIGKLPKMKPGKQHNKNVSVVYTQPIIFYVDN